MILGAFAVSLLAAVLFMGAVGVVLSDNLVHSVFWLAVVLLSTAGLYVTLDAPFLAAIQVILYAGGVITLMLFGVMLTQHDADTRIPNPIARPTASSVTAGLVLGVLLMGIWSTPELGALEPVPGGTALQVGEQFLGRHVLAFEVLSVLLLAAMIGAIVLVRKADP